MFTQFTLGLYKPHIICLGAHKGCFSEMVLLSIHSMCCGLVERKGIILHQALLSVCLVDVYSIYLRKKCHKALNTEHPSAIIRTGVHRSNILDSYIVSMAPWLCTLLA